MCKDIADYQLNNKPRAPLIAGKIMKKEKKNGIQIIMKALTT
jgi:hypothetical protein